MEHRRNSASTSATNTTEEDDDSSINYLKNQEHSLSDEESNVQSSRQSRTIPCSVKVGGPRATSTGASKSRAKTSVTEQGVEVDDFIVGDIETAVKVIEDTVPDVACKTSAGVAVPQDDLFRNPRVWKFLVVVSVLSIVLAFLLLIAWTRSL